MFHAPKRPCSYGGIIYSFFRICQHIFLKKILITDSVPITKYFSVSGDFTLELPFREAKISPKQIHDLWRDTRITFSGGEFPYGRNWMKKL